eukprot:TRINITY_DN51419_c0_g1_i3.p1 TRINITY_DN51419_c0_g1~~TRINITY_DN51419_c0_g1_i3.p1  ORF type:complete len:649 (+),score=93.59 TRINITY_DN51419_c0_g1_i3:403-2349(+)
MTGVPTASIAKGYFKWQSVVLLGGKLYGIPFHADKLLVYDTATEQLSSVHADDPRKPGPSKWHAGCVLRGRVYAVPANASSILVYDPVVKRVSYVDIQQLATCQLKWLTAVVHGGRLYAVPCNAECILEYDPATGTASGISTTSVAQGPGKWLCAVALGGKIYGIPDQADKILVFDPEARTISGVDISEIAKGPAKWQHAVVRGGKMYAVPCNAEQLLVFDPVTGVATGVDTKSVWTGSNKWGTAALLGGRICGVPYDASQLLLFAPPADCCLPSVQEDPGVDIPGDALPEMADEFVAAWLSHWIYTVTDIALPPPVAALTLGGDPLDFTVHWVHEDSMEGSPARFATITVTFPKAAKKILYLIFRGSTNLSDFVVNACTMPDYAPFHRAFGDRGSFVHQGAWHAITQLRVHQNDRLKALLEQSAAAGVTRFIVTGHSLGGQYALAFLFDAFLETFHPHTISSKDAVAPHPLLQNVSAVVLGAPMCFGSADGSVFRQDVAEFVNQRSVNYMTPGDPAPRLWSELDLEGFLKYFAGHLQLNMSSLSRKVVDWASGGLEKRAEELLARKDIEAHLLRPAKCYRHFSRIRMLSAMEYRDWKPLGQDNMNLDDHSVTRVYIPGWRSAFSAEHVGGFSMYEEDGRLVQLRACH